MVMMVGQQLPTVIKPSRSDEVMDEAQQLRIADQVRAQFDSMGPKRPIKPSRSEPDPDASQTQQTYTGPIPELERLQSLKSHSPVVFTTGDGSEQQEFVETQYYNELVAIDKQHHTTGTGFIKVAKEGVENGWDSELQRLLCEDGGKEVNKGSFKSNPATNDWIPSDEQVVYVSNKPSRSG